MSMDKIFEKFKKPRISYSEFKAKNVNYLCKFNSNKKMKSYNRIKLCIGAIIIIFMFSLGFMLRGGNENEKVKINFKVGDFSSLVEVDKGMIISEDIIPFIQYKSIKLYYDNNYTHEYNNEKINKNINIYLKLNTEENTNMVDEVCDAYFKRFIKPKRESAVIEDAILFEYLGTYNGVFVGIFLDKKDCTFIERECQIIVEDLVFKYSYGYNIYVYDGTNFMDLLTAYNKLILSYENILNIYKLHYKMDN